MIREEDSDSRKTPLYLIPEFDWKWRAECIAETLHVHPQPHLPHLLWENSSRSIESVAGFVR
jgi:hypothetical protein